MAPTGATVPRQGNQRRKAAGGGEIFTDSFPLLVGDDDSNAKKLTIDVSEPEKQRRAGAVRLLPG